MSLVSYLSLSDNPGKMAYEARKTLNNYRFFIERQIECIDKCNVVKKANWRLVDNPTIKKEQKSDEKEEKQYKMIIPERRSRQSGEVRATSPV